MPTLIDKPTRIEAAGNKPKLIDEYVGRVNNEESAVSIARMRSPTGWIEPGQTPEFDEYTIVLRGMLRVESREGRFDVHAGQAVVVRRSEWVRYRTPGQVEPSTSPFACPPSRRRRSIGMRTDRVQDLEQRWRHREAHRQLRTALPFRQEIGSMGELIAWDGPFQVSNLRKWRLPAIQAGITVQPTIAHDRWIA